MSYIGNTPFTAAFLTDTFSGDGSDTTFTLSAAPANTSSIIVAVSGVLQDPSTYSVSGTTLTFSAAPPTGTDNISVRFLGIPASGVTTTAYRTVTEFTATAGQTSFSVPSYTAGYVDVYRNGVMLGTADFTATSGTTVVLASGATAGDLIRVESFYVSSVLNAIPAVAGAVNNSYLGALSTITTGGGDTITVPDETGTMLTTASTISTSQLSGTIDGTLVYASTVALSGQGTTVEFTGLPSGVSRVVLVGRNVSLNGNTNVLIQIGTDSGGYATSGYTGTTIEFASTTVGTSNFSSSVYARGCDQASESYHYDVTFTKLPEASNEQWVISGQCGRAAGATHSVFVGARNLTTLPLTKIRITASNGTSTFDDGTVSLYYWVA